MPAHIDRLKSHVLLKGGNASPESPPMIRRESFRICFCSDFFHPNVGGVESHMWNIAQTLIDRGHKVVVVSSTYSNERIGVRHLSNGLKVYHIPTLDMFRQCSAPDFFF